LYKIKTFIELSEHIFTINLRGKIFLLPISDDDALKTMNEANRLDNPIINLQPVNKEKRGTEITQLIL
jgi:hypothetical protein